MKKFITITILILGLSVAISAQRRKVNEPRGKSGIFDYYVLSLSWSPQYCAQAKGRRDEIQCAQGRQYGFVVHGLWPQYERGWPQNCSTGETVPPLLVQKLLPLMPSPQLIQHEWQRHGTCSGLSQEEYFHTVEQVFQGLKVPNDFQAPLRQVQIRPQMIKRKFIDANPAMPETGIRVLCGGRFLSEVRLCYTKQLKPRPCSTDVRDGCRNETILMQPVR